MITTDPTVHLQEETRTAGIRGLCAKNETQCLEDAIDTVIRGGTYFGEQAAA
jgi:DNA-binding NarL/FixJ family response regulator